MLMSAVLKVSMGLCMMSANAAEEALRRSLTEADGHLTYQVGPRAPTLYMISRDLYGSEARWKDLAEWNHLEKPYRLTPGQRLVIESPPTSDEAAGDEAVAKAWSKLGDEALAARLREGRREPAEVPAAAPAAPVATEAPVAATPTVEVIESSLAPDSAPTPAPATPPTPTAEVAPAVADVPPAVVVTPVETPVPVIVTPAPTPTPTPCQCAPRPSPLPANALAQDGNEDDVVRWRWQWRADLITSIFHLNSARTGGASETNLNSRVNYGLEVEGLYKFTNQYALGLVASSERVSIATPEGGAAFRQSANDFTRVGLIARARPSEAWALHFGVASAERPLPLMTTRGLVLYSVVLPEVTLGTDLPFIDVGWSAAFLAEGLWTAPTSDKRFDVRAGYGGHLGVRFEYPYGEARWTLALRYRYLREDTAAARNRVQAGLMNLGITW